MFSKSLAALAALILTLGIAIPSYSQLGDITQAEDTTVDVGGNVDGDEISYTVAAVVPWTPIKGGIQAYVQQQQSDSEVISENIKVRAEGGFDWWILDIAAFIEFERSLKEGTNTGSFGPFIRLPEYVNGNLTVSSGGGSWLQNQDVQEEVGDEVAVGAYSVRPFVYGSGDYGPVNLFGKLSTDYQNLEDIEGEIIPSLVLKVADNISVGILASFKYSRLGEMTWHSRFSAVARAVF